MVRTNRQERSHRRAERASPAEALPGFVAPDRAGAATTARRNFTLIPLCWLLAAATVAVDWPVYSFWHARSTPGFIVDLLDSAESFGNGAGVVLMIAVAYCLRAVSLRATVRLALASLGAGLVADAFKLIIARTRPRDLTIQQSAWETFGAWWPSPNAETAFQSFPSAHVATAVGLAFALSHFYPRGRWVFGMLAALVVVQRLQTGAHFASDAMAGVAIGWGTAVVLYQGRWLAPLLDRFEARSANGHPTISGSGVPAPHRIADR